jgi:hypothetical protein
MNPERSRLLNEAVDRIIESDEAPASEEKHFFSDPDAKQTHDFLRDGRTDDEVKEMIEYGYAELEKFAGSTSAATKGYVCANCRFFDPRPNTMPENSGEDDGWCGKFKFRDRGHGCCSGWATLGLRKDKDEP